MISSTSKQDILKISKEDDHLYFLENFVHSIHPVFGITKLEPYNYQMSFVNNIHQNDKSLALMHKQAGKSSLSLAYALWYALIYSYSNVIYATYSTICIKEAKIKLKVMYDNLPDELKDGCKISKGLTNGVRFSNGSSLNFINNSLSLRGWSIDLLVIDELSYFKEKDFYKVAKYAVNNGKIAITGSLGRNPEFLDLLENRDYEGFSYFESKWYDNPHYTNEWAEKQKYYIGKENFLSEFENKIK